MTIFDVGEWRGRPFIVMEYLGGGTLKDVLRAGAPPLERALGWIGQAARSLDAAHAHGVVHRDIKPANLLLDTRGNLFVGDFGIATAAGLASLTLTGAVLGTAGYLAPEQALGRPATAATDGYALAVVAFELLTGIRPFERDSPPAEAAAHAYAAVPSALEQNPALPAAVDPVFRRALAKSPERSLPDLGAFRRGAIRSVRRSLQPSHVPQHSVPQHSSGRRPTAVRHPTPQPSGPRPTVQPRSCRTHTAAAPDGSPWAPAWSCSRVPGSRAPCSRLSATAPTAPPRARTRAWARGPERP